MAHRFATFDLAGNAKGGGLAGLLRRVHGVLTRPWGRGDVPTRVLRWLSPQAKALLRQALQSQEGTLHALTVPGSAIGLELADVISIFRDRNGTYGLAVNAWAAEHLRRHPELLAE